MHDADRRHIELAYKKLGDNGLVEEVVAIRTTQEPSRAHASKPPPSLRIVNTNIILPSQVRFRNPWTQQKTSFIKPIAALKRSAEQLSSANMENKCSRSSDDREWPTIGEDATSSHASNHTDEGRPSTRRSISGVSPRSSVEKPLKLSQAALMTTHVGLIASL